MSVRAPLVVAICTVCAACVGCVAPGAVDDVPAGACGIDDAIAFDALAGEVLQARGDGWCARIDRAPPTASADAATDPPVRRGQEWRALRLRVEGPEVHVDATGADASYVASHHNCADEVHAGDVVVTIDGTGDGSADVCFSGAPSDGWLVRVAADGQATVELAPVAP